MYDNQPFQVDSGPGGGRRIELPPIEHDDRSSLGRSLDGRAEGQAFGSRAVPGRQPFDQTAAWKSPLRQHAIEGRTAAGDHLRSEIVFPQAPSHSLPQSGNQRWPGLALDGGCVGHASTVVSYSVRMYRSASIPFFSPRTGKREKKPAPPDGFSLPRRSEVIAGQ